MSKPTQQPPFSFCSASEVFAAMNAAAATKPTQQPPSSINSAAAYSDARLEAKFRDMETQFAALKSHLDSRKRTTDVNQCLATRLATLKIGDLSALHAVQSECDIHPLVMHNANLEERTPEGLTPFLFAINKNDRWEKISALLEAGADPKATDNFGNTALHLCRNPDITESFMKLGIDIEARNKREETPLLSQVRCGNTVMACRLIELGADVCARGGDEDGRTIFGRDVDVSEEVARCCLNRGKLMAKNIAQNNLVSFVRDKKYTCAELARRSGANAVTARDPRGNTVMFCECPLPGPGMGTYARSILYWIERGVDLNTKNEKGWTALMHHAFVGDVNAMKTLIHNGAKIVPDDMDEDAFVDFVKKHVTSWSVLYCLFNALRKEEAKKQRTE